jgi:hypothetical protein
MVLIVGCPKDTQNKTELNGKKNEHEVTRN